MDGKFKNLIDEIAQIQGNLYHQDFLLTWEKSLADIRSLLLTAEALMELYHQNVSARVFQSGLAISQFRDQSTRTRFSFSSAANLLGLTVQDLDEGKSQIAHGETVRETSVMISFLSDIIGIRDDIYLGAGNSYMREVGSALDEAYREGVLAQRPGIINLQCDIDHPTQTLADLLFLKTRFGSLENLRGKKIAMSWAYSPSYGKPLSVPQGIIGLMTRLGMQVDLATPPGYDLLPEITGLAHQQAQQSGGGFRQVDSMQEAFESADIVYPKSWAPMRVMQQRTVLLKAGDATGLKKLEAECLADNARFKTWECTERMMGLTRDRKAVYMHCLPADISGVSCSQGEVSATVFERNRTSLYKQAGFKPFIIAAMMLTNRFENPALILQKLKENRTGRILS